MVFLYVLLIIFLAGAMYVLFAPIYIEIDSIHSIYRIRFHRLFYLSFFVNNNITLIEIKMGFWKRQIDLSKLKVKETSPIQKKKKAPGSFPFKRTITVIRSFRVNKLDATFDSGDMQWNGMLYPLFCWLRYKTGKNICINFEGKNNIVLQMQNNIARLSRAFLCS